MKRMPAELRDGGHIASTGTSSPRRTPTGVRKGVARVDHAQGIERGVIVIGPKRTRLTKKQERDAYAAATERDSKDGHEQCQMCGRFGPCDRDHRQNRDPFNTTPANLQLLGSSIGGCGCHLVKTLNPALAVERGFTVPRWADPLTWPGFRYGVGWVRYFDEPDEAGRWLEPLTVDQAVALMLGKEVDVGAN